MIKLTRFISYALLSTLVSLQANVGLAKDPPAAQESEETPTDGLKPGMACTSTREYITTLEYFRSHKEYIIPEDEARKLALEVSHGCTGAAQRFAKISSVLFRAGIAPKDSIHTALFFAKRSNTDTETFVSIFLKAFLKDFLDLDPNTSLKMAFGFFQNFDGNSLTVRADFDRFVDFCTRTDELNQSLPKCAVFATRLTQRGQRWNGKMAEPFIKLYHFLTSDKGPELSTWKALEMAEKLIDGGPGGAENYIQAFKYATSKSGLDMNHQQAIAFAEQMTLSNQANQTNQDSRANQAN